jgi:16S rRNA (uracil1498-N3)-methyltransferase
MHRIWVPDDIQEDQELQLAGGEARRLLNVLRLGPGARLRVFNDRGVEGEAEILRGAGGKVQLRIHRVALVDRESPLDIRLFQALVKGDRMTWILQKTTELGIDEVGVLVVNRCVPRWHAGQTDGRMDRWRRVMIEAARQCGRTRLPVLTGPWSPETLSRRALASESVKILLWEGEERSTLRKVLTQVESPREIWISVGPEGGLEASEVHDLDAAGFRSVRLGPRILRAETAGPVAVAVLQYLYGDLG